MTSIIKTVGDSKKLLSYQKTDTIYQITYFFCHQYMKIGDRTIVPIIQGIMDVTLK